MATGDQVVQRPPRSSAAPDRFHSRAIYRRSTTLTPLRFSSIDRVTCPPGASPPLQIPTTCSAPRAGRTRPQRVGPTITALHAMKMPS